VKVFIGLVVGYVLGARTGGKDLEQLSESLKALADTDEFSDVVAAARSQLGHTLRDLAAIVDGNNGDRAPDDPSLDLVARVRHIVSRG
jgi:hypothetical protein